MKAASEYAKACERRDKVSAMLIVAKKRVGELELEREACEGRVKDAREALESPGEFVPAE